MLFEKVVAGLYNQKRLPTKNVATALASVKKLSTDTPSVPQAKWLPVKHAGCYVAEGSGVLLGLK